MMIHRYKKGQIAGQIFIYMMAVIVIGAIALIGYSAISKVVTKSCDAEKAGFKSNIDELIDKYTSYGSVNKKTIHAPCDYKTICFVDSAAMGRNIACSNRLIRDSVAAGAENNIFVKSNDRTIPIGYSGLISLNDTAKNTCLCIEARSGNFYMVFNGLGSTTQINGG